MESESGISFTEFTYQLLQGYDFVHLCREHGVRVQVSCVPSLHCNVPFSCTHLAYLATLIWSNCGLLSFKPLS